MRQFEEISAARFDEDTSATDNGVSKPFFAALATETVQIGVRDVIARRPKNFKALQDVSTLRLPGI